MKIRHELNHDASFEEVGGKLEWLRVDLSGAGVDTAQAAGVAWLSRGDR